MYFLFQQRKQGKRERIEESKQIYSKARIRDRIALAQEQRNEYVND